jgi:hypothetical protein
MSEMKQTAVEWLAQQIQEQMDFFIPGAIIDNNMVKKAKEMEKEQIIEAHGNKKKLSEIAIGCEYNYTGEQYYNQNFKSFCPCDDGIIVCPGCNGEQSKFGICAGCHGEGKVVCGKCGGKNNKSI